MRYQTYGVMERGKISMLGVLEFEKWCSWHLVAQVKVSAKALCGRRKML